MKSKAKKRAKPKARPRRVIHVRIAKGKPKRGAVKIKLDVDKRYLVQLERRLHKVADRLHRKDVLLHRKSLSIARINGANQVLYIAAQMGRDYTEFGLAYSRKDSRGIDANLRQLRAKYNKLEKAIAADQKTRRELRGLR